jgi:beta-galactosidase
VRLGRRFVHGWESIALPLDAEGLVERLRLDAERPPQHAPALGQATFVVERPADGFIALPGWGKGFAWLNGFLLGRYWSIGPQRTLYAPAPLWRSGRNVVTVLELHEPGQAVELRDEPDLGDTATT